jgi:hypothetical protein
MAHHRRDSSPSDVRWLLHHHRYVNILKGEAIRALLPDQKVIDLYRDGTMIAAVPADESFLAWGRTDKQRLNPVALIEVVYAFVNLYSRVLGDFHAAPSTVTIRIELRHMHLEEQKTKLSPYGIEDAQQYGMHDQEAPDDHASLEYSIAVKDFQPASVVFSLVKEIYLWFGIEEDKIPYMKSEGGQRVFDPAAIQKL